MSTKLEQLAETAKKAQREYDNAVHEEKSKKTKQLITATSTKEGFSWACEAPQQLVIKHTKATLMSAFDTLKDDPMGEMLLTLEVMDALQDVTKIKAKV